MCTGGLNETISTDQGLQKANPLQTESREWELCITHLEHLDVKSLGKLADEINKTSFSDGPKPMDDEHPLTSRSDVHQGTRCLIEKCCTNTQAAAILRLPHQICSTSEDMRSTWS